MNVKEARDIALNPQNSSYPNIKYYMAQGYLAALNGPEVKALIISLSEAREMLGVFEDNGGHDGLGGKAYAITLNHIDEALKTFRDQTAKTGGKP